MLGDSKIFPHWHIEQLTRPTAFPTCFFFSRQVCFPVTPTTCFGFIPAYRVLICLVSNRDLSRIVTDVDSME